MESQYLASWPSPANNGLIQNDSITTTALITPPSPIRSPTLYENSENGTGSGPGIVAKGFKLGSTRSQLAASLLRDIELGREEQYPHSGFLGEEFVNLELFEDLVSTYDNCELGIGGTPPLSPELSYVNDQLYDQSSPSPVLTAEFPDEGYNQLKAEFQKILESLPESSIGMGLDEDAIDLFESIMEMELSDDVEQESGDDSSSSSSETGSDDQDSSQDSMDIDMKVEEGVEVELSSTSVQKQESLDIKHSFFLTPTGVETDDEVSEKILNALIVGDLTTANSYIPENQVKTTTIYQLAQPIQIVTIIPSSTVMASIPGNSTTVIVPSTSTATPSKKNSPRKEKSKAKTPLKKPRLSPRVDRVQRKKDQNKTAATRYREKKKVLATIVTHQEDELQSENNRLNDQKNDLSKQILMVKQLLREVMNARKKNSFGSSKRAK